MTDKDLIDMLRKKQICTGFKPDGHGGVDIVYGPDPVTARAAWRIEALSAERDMALAEWDDCVERIICGLPVCQCGMSGPCKAPVPAAQPDPDQRREDRDERAGLAREDDQ